MLFSYFTEQPYSALSVEDVMKVHPFDHPARRSGDNVLLHSNRFFDPVAGSLLYRQRLEEYDLAEEVGYDGIMLNEHHNAAFCMQARCTTMAAMVAARTKRVKIVQLGNPLPLWDNPVQLAEDLAIIDMVSNGRLVSGIVRGGGQEQIANNINPAFNRERFVEAHDLMIKAWTVPGPYRWEGDHYHLRVVNPWAIPLQKPHPRIWVPGVSSNETIAFAAAHGYPYIALSTTLETTKKIWAYYDKIASENGYQAGPSYRGYLMRCHVANTEKKAIESAREFMWMNGSFTGTAHPVWGAPTGYTALAGRRARMAALNDETSFEKQLEDGTLIAGTPSQVIEKIRIWLKETRPGMLMLWQNDGFLSHSDSLESIRLMGTEVLPALRKIAADLGLQSPFETGQPVSRDVAKREASFA